MPRFFTETRNSSINASGVTGLTMSARPPGHSARAPPNQTSERVTKHSR